MRKTVVLLSFFYFLNAYAADAMETDMPATEESTSSVISKLATACTILKDFWFEEEPDVFARDVEATSFMALLAAACAIRE